VKGKGIAAYLRLDAKTAGCVVEDISAGGLFLRTDRVVPVGTTISLDLVDPEVKRGVTISGQVVGIILKEAAAKRGGMPGLRIRFNRQAGATYAYLQKLLARLGAPQDDAPVFYGVTQPPPRLRRERGPEPQDEPPVLFPVEMTRQGEGEDDVLEGEPYGADEAYGADEGMGETPIPARPEELLDRQTRGPRGGHVVVARPEGFGRGRDYEGPGEEESTLVHEPDEEGEAAGAGRVPGEEEATGDMSRAAAHKAEVAALRLRVAELEAEIGRLSTALEQQMAQSEEHVRELRTALAERDRMIADLRGEAGELRAQLADGGSLTPIRPPPRRR
jgi:Tfp pilus assembly protein PilZ